MRLQPRAVCIAVDKTSEIAAGNHRDGVLERGHWEERETSNS
jgi:hypothetical protein